MTATWADLYPLLVGTGIVMIDGSNNVNLGMFMRREWSWFEYGKRYSCTAERIFESRKHFL